MESDIIKISHLNKSFSEVKAVNDLSFRVKKGELFAFLGVNGAGKSTTISILCGLQKKDSGTVQVNGIETDKAGAQTKRMLGVVFQDSVLDKPLTVKENLKSRAALYGITGNAFDKRLQELVEILDFDEFLNRPVGKLSGGIRSLRRRRSKKGSSHIWEGKRSSGCPGGSITTRPTSMWIISVPSQPRAMWYWPGPMTRRIPSMSCPWPA